MNSLKTANLFRLASRRVGVSGRRGLTTGSAFRQGTTSSSKPLLTAAGLVVAATTIVELQRQEVCSITFVYQSSF